MRKTLLIISLGMSMAYADSEERSWTEKAMDKGREIKISVEGYIDAFAYIVHDHYVGLIKGADYWYNKSRSDGYDSGYYDGYYICYDQSLRSYDYGYDIGYAKGRNDNEFNDYLSADDGERYNDCINTDYREGYSEGYSDGHYDGWDDY